jgi:hypothetical protein
MCGIVGFLGDPNNTYEILKIKYLLHCNQSRGKDATGIWNIKDKLQKNLDEAEDFIINKSIKWTEDNILIGHCRSSSSGSSKIIDNAHPHEYKNVVGVHNGTLRFLYDLEKKYNSNKLGKQNVSLDYIKFTDSQLLYSIINNTNSTKVLSHIEGSAALLFHDKNKPNILYAYRKEDSGSDERPLFYGFSKVKKHSGIYFSSIEKSLKVIDCENITTINSGGISIFEDGKFKEFIPIKKVKTNSSTNNHSNGYSSYYRDSNYNNNYAISPDLFKDRWFKNEKTNEWLKYNGGLINANTASESYVCINTDNKYSYIDKSDFPKFRPKTFYKNDDVVFMTDVVDKKDESEYLFIKDQVCKVLDIHYSDKKVSIKSLADDSIREICFSFIREASSTESSLWLITDKNGVFNESDIKTLILNKSKKNKQKDNQNQDNDLYEFKKNNLKKLSSDIIKDLMNNDKFLERINNDLTILEQLEETINYDYESIEYKLSELYDCVKNLNYVSDDDPLELIIDLLLTIVTINQ